MKDLLFEGCGYAAPAAFVPTFIALHNGDWREAEGHWERIVVEALDTDAVRPDAGPAEAMRQAVDTVTLYLVEVKGWPFCPFCPARQSLSSGKGMS